MQYSTIFLDAGSVLVYPNWQRVSDILAHHGVAVSADALRAVEPRAKKSLDTPRVRTTTDAQRGGEYFDLVLDAAGVPRNEHRQAGLADVYAYHMEHNIWEHVPEEVHPTLAALRAAGLTLAVASNANGVLHRCFDRNELTRYFDVICDSAVEGVEKPDPRFFELLLERSGSRPETTLHVGDLYHVDVAGARSAGLAAVLLDPQGLYDGYDVDRVRRLPELLEYVGVPL